MLYFTKKDLQERGWRKRDIKIHLMPVDSIENPHYPHGPKMYRFDPDLVKRLETSHTVCLRSETEGEKLAMSRRWALKLRIKVVQNLCLNKLREQYIINSDRHMVAMVRHMFSNYEKLMDLCDLRVGAAMAKKIVRTRIMREIASTYPSLRQGCCEQWAVWYGTYEF